MITLGKMKWSNCFSYAEDNEIDFSANQLTQIVGLNGHGKSSIALILEEVLYNKNSKNLKKSDILNRNMQAKSYEIEIAFDKDGTTYYIKTTRATLATVKFFKDSIDISSHTATGTYKLIEEVIGFDHKTFAQVVYQSNAAGLEFLTATDSNRKKFLIDLLNLSKYVDAADIFKAAAKEVGEQVTILTTKVSTTEAWIAKYVDTNTVEIGICSVPEAPHEYIEKVAELNQQVKTIDADNKKITQNNTYKSILDGIVLDAPIQRSVVNLAEYQIMQIECSTAIKTAEALIAKIRKAGAACPTCAHKVDQPQAEGIIITNTIAISDNKVLLAELTAISKEANRVNALVTTQELNKQEYEEYHSLYDASLSASLINKDVLELLIETNEANIISINSKIKSITSDNTIAIAHNAKIEVIIGQLKEFREELIVLRAELTEVSVRLSTLQVLVKTFSPGGLVAYKIECLVKDLEEVINEYLNEISSGRFQLSFVIAGADKLNVVITDNGRDIDILALSGGERARVNTAALLGIRKLMQSLSNARINLLILDETISSLDIDGKEKLVDVLLAEEHLNTFIISHDFTHPLLEKINVIKENNISRIES